MLYLSRLAGRELARLFYLFTKVKGDPISDHKHRVNERIRIREVRLIDEEGNNLGIKPTREALEYARSKDLDLVEVAPNAKPPVCRVMDFGKFMYEQTKREREAKKAQKQVEVKELRLRPKTDDYHLSLKIKQARGFLEKGTKVRFRILFRGREAAHPEIARELLNEVVTALKDTAEVEQTPVFEGRSMTLVLTPANAKAGAR